MALRISGTPWPSQRTSLQSLAMEAAGKLPSAMTSVSPWPISHRIERSSGGSTGEIPLSMMYSLNLMGPMKRPARRLDARDNFRR